MWREALILVVAAAAMAKCDFDPHDQNEFIDDPGDYEDPVTSNPLRVPDIASPGDQTKDVQGAVEKLLGQPVFHYEDPATTPPVPTPPSASPQSQQSEVQQTESQKETQTREFSETIQDESQEKESEERPSQLKGFQYRESQQRESQDRGEHRKFQQLVTEIEENIPERRQTDQTNIISEWSHEAPTHQSTPAFILEMTSTKFRRRPKLKTRSPRHSINEVVYSIQVPWEAEHPRNGRGPGVVESLVGGHDIVHHEIPNLGGTRSRPDTRTEYVLTTKDDSARRYLLTIPAHLKTIRTRPPRPTPTTIRLVTTYKFTRMTRRHPNCTDTYYECLLKCFDKRGYRVKCPWDTPPPRPEPARLNFTGVFFAINSPLDAWDTKPLLKEFRQIILDKGYRDCKNTTRKTTTVTKLYPVYYDNLIAAKTGAVMAKCWVCGLTDQGVPTNSYCADNFGRLGNSLALAEKSTYRRRCRYMNEVNLWYNRSDPAAVFGPWTGGCSTRWLDVSGLYTQRTCRSTVHPAMGHHFLSKRMALLELALRDERQGCAVSPVATLVPFSRAISLFARVHVCVCAGSFCNNSPRKAETQLIGAVILMILLFLRL